MGELVPEVHIDRNGRLVTRHVRAVSFQKTARALPPPILRPTAPNDRKSSISSLLSIAFPYRDGEFIDVNGDPVGSASSVIPEHAKVLSGLPENVFSGLTAPLELCVSDPRVREMVANIVYVIAGEMARRAECARMQALHLADIIAFSDDQDAVSVLARTEWAIDDALLVRSKHFTVEEQTRIAAILAIILPDGDAAVTPETGRYILENTDLILKYRSQITDRGFVDMGHIGEWGLLETQSLASGTL